MWISHITQFSHTFAADQKYDSFENWLYKLISLFNYRSDIEVSFSTCSVDIEFCPDLICDSLEEISGHCPQDCITRGNINPFIKSLLNVTHIKTHNYNI